MSKKDNEGVPAPSSNNYHYSINDEYIHIVTGDIEETILIDTYADPLVLNFEIPYNIAREIVIQGIEKCSVLGEIEEFQIILIDKYNIDYFDAETICQFLSFVLYQKKYYKPQKLDEYFSIEQITNEDGEIIEETIERVENQKTTKHYQKIRTLQPGSGKTYQMLQKINANKEGKDLVLGADHLFLGELATKVQKPFIVLKGFKRACERYDENSDDGKLIRRLYESEDSGEKLVGNKLICIYMNCPNKESCPYHTQFSEMKNVGVSVAAPVNFLHVLDFDMFDNIYVEESILDRTFNISWNKDLIRKNFLKLKFEDKKEQKTIWSFINKQSPQLYLFEEQLRKKIDNHNENLAMCHSYKINEENFKNFVNCFCALNLNNMLLYLEFMKRDINHILSSGNTYVIDYQMLIFYRQLYCNKPITYNCARENIARNRFLDIMKLYETLFPEFNGVVNISYSHKTRKTSKIIKYGNNGFYKKDLNITLKTYEKQIKNLLQNLQNKQKRKVFVITYKDLVKTDKNQKYGTFWSYPALWFGGAHGVNEFENYDDVIVIGTFLPDQTYYDHMLQKYNPEYIPTFEVAQIAGRNVPIDPILFEYYKQDFEDNVYDTIHRSRLLLHDVTIHWFGNNIPSKLKEEVTYIEK